MLKSIQNSMATMNGSLTTLNDQVAGLRVDVDKINDLLWNIHRQLLMTPKRRGVQ